MNVKNFNYYQPNKKDLKDKYGDCVVRSLTLALNEEWKDVYTILCRKGLELQEMPNSNNVYRSILEKAGFERHWISIRNGNKRPTVKRFAYEHKDEKVYVLELSGHLVSCTGGNYYDTWDSGNRRVMAYYCKGD